MLLSTLWLASIQVAPAILILWAFSRLFPALSPKVQGWLWRLVFLRLTLGLFLWPAVEVPILPSQPPAIYAAETTSAAVGDLATEASPFPTAEVAWASGVLLLGLLALRQSLRVRRIATTSEPLATVHVAAERSSTFGALVRVCPQAAYPMVVGPWKPTILLPQRLVDESTQSEIRLVIAHEMGHIVHRDLWWSWLTWAGRTLFFFHPLVWLAARCERMARETAADRYAVEASGTDAHSYGQVLLRVALGGARPSSLSPTGLAMSDSFRFIYRRLETMKHLSQRPTRGRIVVTCTLCALTIGLLPAFSLVPGGNQEPFSPTMDPPVVPVIESTDIPSQSPLSTPVEEVIVQGHSLPTQAATAPRARHPRASVRAAVPLRASAASTARRAPTQALAPARVEGVKLVVAAPSVAIAPAAPLPVTRVHAASAPSAAPRPGAADPTVAPAAPALAPIQVDTQSSATQIPTAALAPVVRDSLPLTADPTVAVSATPRISRRVQLRTSGLTVTTVPSLSASVSGRAALLPAVASTSVQGRVSTTLRSALRVNPVQVRTTTLTGRLISLKPSTTTRTLVGTTRLNTVKFRTVPNTRKLSGLRSTTRRVVTTLRGVTKPGSKK